MNRRHRPLAVPILILLTLLLTAGTPEALAEEPVKLTSFASRFYTIHTNLTREEAKPIGAHMDSVYTEYSRRFAAFRKRPGRGAMPLYLFRTQEQYEAFLGSHGINAANSGGMFFVQRSIQGLATFIQGRSLSAAYAVLQHEGFHQFVYHHMEAGLPIWINEGLAQYFEDGIFTGNQFHVGAAHGRRVNAVKKALEEGTALRFETLLRRTSEEWHKAVVSGSPEAQLQYDQSWSIAYFLIHGDNGKYKVPFEKFLLMVSSNIDSDTAFRNAFGSGDKRPFQLRWEAFAKEAKPDPLNTAIARMNFLSQGLQFLHQNNRPTPATIDELRTALQQVRFRLTRSEPGLVSVYHAEDDSLYAFPLNGNTSPFTLLEPEKDTLPPRIVARGLKPEPTLTWSRDGEDQLASDITFK